jgi:hypothetical protein
VHSKPKVLFASTTTNVLAQPSTCAFLVNAIPTEWLETLALAVLNATMVLAILANVLHTLKIKLAPLVTVQLVISVPKLLDSVLRLFPLVVNVDLKFYNFLLTSSKS